jgi:hypothetical protein
MALATRGHSDKLGSAADACAMTPQASAAAALTLVRNDATLPKRLLSRPPAASRLASELIVDSQQERAPVGVVFQRGLDRTTHRQSRDLDGLVR